MQAPTHFLVAIVCAKWIEIYWGITSPLLMIVFIALIAFLSHYLVDLIVFMTYHPKEAHPQDKFWVGYHIWAFGLTLFLVIWFWNPFWWVMICSVLVDIIDWGVLRGILHRPTIFHPFIERIRDKYFSWIPNCTEQRWAIIPELIILTGLVVIIYLI
jgi:hypothetical protein